jgi:hypothetical protein
LAGQLLAISRDEAWAADGAGIWHLRGRTWEGPLHPTGLEDARVRAIALGPDGELWAATESGIAVLRDGAWATAWRGDAWTLAVGPDGTAWAGGDTQAIVRLAASGDGFEVREISCPVGATSLAIATDGSVYLGDFAYTRLFPGLARYDGRSCAKLDPLGDGSTPDVVGLAAHPDGGVVALLLGRLPGYPGGGRWSSHLVQVDGGRSTTIEEMPSVDGAWGFTVASDGGIWRGSPSRPGLERFDGRRWATVIDGVEIFGPIAVAPDGAIYFGGPSGLQRYVPPTEP